MRAPGDHKVKDPRKPSPMQRATFDSLRPPFVPAPRFATEGDEPHSAICLALEHIPDNCITPA